MKKLILLLLSLSLISCSTPKEEEYIPVLKRSEKNKLNSLLSDYYSNINYSLNYTNLNFELSMSDISNLRYYAVGHFDYSSSFYGTIEFTKLYNSYVENGNEKRYSISTTYTFKSDDLHNAIFQSKLLLSDGTSFDFYIDPVRLRFLDSISHEEISLPSEIMESLADLYQDYLEETERIYERFSMIGTGVLSIIKDKHSFFPPFESTVDAYDSTIFLKPTARISYFNDLSINNEDPIPFHKLDPLYQTLSLALYIDSPVSSMKEIPEESRLLWLLQMSPPSLLCERNGEYDKDFNFIFSQDCLSSGGNTVSPPNLLSHYNDNYAVYDVDDINQLQSQYFPNADPFNVDETLILPSGILQEKQENRFFHNVDTYLFEGGLLIEEVSENTYAVIPYYNSSYLYRFSNPLKVDYYIHNIDNIFPLGYFEYVSLNTFLEEQRNQLSWFEIKVEPLENSESYQIVSIKTISN